MLAAIINGKSRITNISSAEDVMSTAMCLRKTGIDINVNKNRADIRGGTFGKANEMLDCGNSGTSMRLLAGLYSYIQL